MDQRRLWIATVLGLAISTSFLIWFDYAAATAFLHPTTDPLGRTLFQVPGYQNTVYPFTYVGVAASVVGVAIFVFREERGAMPPVGAAALALVVANLASIGMIDTYEQVFVGLRYFTGFGHADSAFWLAYYWSDIRSAGMTLAGMLVVLAVLPWSRRQNWPGVAVCLGLYGLFMATWILHGYADPQKGDAMDYWSNAGSRIASQLALVAAVAPVDLAARLRTVARRIRRPRLRLGTREPHAVPPS